MNLPDSSITFYPKPIPFPFLLPFNNNSYDPLSLKVLCGNHYFKYVQKIVYVCKSMKKKRQKICFMFLYIILFNKPFFSHKNAIVLLHNFLLFVMFRIRMKHCDKKGMLPGKIPVMPFKRPVHQSFVSAVRCTSSIRSSF